MQISTKIAGAIAAVVLVGGAAYSGIFLSRHADRQRGEFAAENREAMELLALSVAPAVAQGEHHHVQAVLDNIANFPDRFPDITTLSLIDSRGRIIASLDPTQFNQKVAEGVGADSFVAQLALHEAEVRFSDIDHLTVAVPLRLTHPIGVMRAELSAKRLNQTISQQRRQAIILVMLTMASIALLLLAVHRSLVGNRLGELAKTASELGKGDMGVRAVATGNDEIAALGKSFNEMAAALQAYTSDLESMVEDRTIELSEANLRLEKMATTDQLTGLSNRRYFEDAARRALEVARRNERPVSICLVDADKFKSINDTFGHPVGDKVLKAVATTLMNTARKADLVARIGGEEFAIVMPEAGVGLAAQGAERMRKALEEEVTALVPELNGRLVTASFGVAAFDQAGAGLDELLLAADQAMYESKEHGRNRVTLATAHLGDPGGQSDD